MFSFSLLQKKLFNREIGKQIEFEWDKQGRLIFVYGWRIAKMHKIEDLNCIRDRGDSQHNLLSLTSSLQSRNLK